eukprot:symbB.v1.2.040227.t1/scaffold7085.1/size15199/2
MLGDGEVQMQRLQSLLCRLERFPHSIVPQSIIRLIESLHGARSSWGPGRVLERWICAQPWRKALPEALEIDVPVSYEDARGEMRSSGKHAMFLPHEILGTFYRFRHVDLMERLTGGPGALEEFWSHEKSTEWFRNHPILQAVPLQHVVPFRIFGDGAESHRKHKFEILTLVLPVLTGRSATMDTHILLSCMSGTYCNSSSRLRILETLRWSFDALSSGCFPKADPWGTEWSESYYPHRKSMGGQRIAGPYVGVLEGLQGDQDFIRVLMSPSRFFSRQYCCYYCRAVQWVYIDENDQLSNYLYTSFGPDAHHRQTLVSTHEWFDVNSATPLAQIVGWSPWRIMPDIMHITHLAVATDVITSCLLDWSDDDRFFGIELVLLQGLPKWNWCV